MAYILAKKQPPSTSTGIYGAKWLGTLDPAWIRTDDAANFADPNPYYAGMSDTPSSPFDTISPWKDLERVEDSEAGTLVKIPKYYYKWTRTGDEMLLQISATRQTGFFVSPAHADRGDGKGERDVVYVGRYHCASDYKSKTGVKPKESENIGTFRSNIHNLGTTIWINDYALWWTIRMLYLVEFAHWNSQEKIGYGCGNGSLGNMGYTDNMPYHTGTTQSSRTTFGLGTQYRHIEGLWDNSTDWCDGIYFGGTNNATIYCIKNPANFSSTTGGTNVGTRTNNSGLITGWTNPSVTGFEYALYPTSVITDSAFSTYICDYCAYSSTGIIMQAGCNYNPGVNRGLFWIYSTNNASATSGETGSRLMKLP